MPKELRGKYREKAEDGKLKLGLVQDFELLYELKDSFGTLFRQKKEVLLSAINRRNLSILAHGLNPLSFSEYEEVYSKIVSFIKEAAKEVNINIDVPQLPKSL